MSVSETRYPCGARVASTAFDQIAESYDDLFTRSVVGRAQRAAVWDVLVQTFRSGNRVLELNCGTGEDALFLARAGVSTVACDASATMIEVARRKVAEGEALPIEFRICRTEEIQSLGRKLVNFDGAVSNFAGLNCVEDLRTVAQDLAPMIKQGGQMILCLSNRICIWEILWLGAHLKFRKALRRISGRGVGHIGEAEVRVWYPKVKQVRQAFAPWFRLKFVQGIGLCVPPSYLERWAAKHREVISHLAAADALFSRLPILRILGDHVLLRLERVSS